MSGSGAGIGLMRIITRIAPGTIPGALEMGNNACCAAAIGAVIRGPCVRCTAIGSTLRSGTTALAFVWALLPGSYFLRSDFLFAGC
jgi:hypothetical protein